MDCALLLEEISLEHKFDATYVDIEENTHSGIQMENNNEQRPCLLKTSSTAGTRFFFVGNRRVPVPADHVVDAHRRELRQRPFLRNGAQAGRLQRPAVLESDDPEVNRK